MNAIQLPYDEGIAIHVGSESCVVIREDIGEALTGESAGWVLSSEILNVRDADAVMSRGRQHRLVRQREDRPGPAESQTPRTHRSISRERRSLLGEGNTLRIGSREGKSKRDSSDLNVRNVIQSRPVKATLDVTFSASR